MTSLGGAVEEAFIKIMHTGMGIMEDDLVIWKTTT